MKILSWTRPHAHVGAARPLLPECFQLPRSFIVAGNRDGIQGEKIHGNSQGIQVSEFFGKIKINPGITAVIGPAYNYHGDVVFPKLPQNSLARLAARLEDKDEALRQRVETALAGRLDALSGLVPYIKLVERERLESKKVSKTSAVTSQKCPIREGIRPSAARSTAALARVIPSTAARSATFGSVM